MSTVIGIVACVMALGLGALAARAVDGILVRWRFGSLPQWEPGVECTPDGKVVREYLNQKPYIGDVKPGNDYECESMKSTQIAGYIWQVTCKYKRKDLP